MDQRNAAVSFLPECWSSIHPIAVGNEGEWHSGEPGRSKGSLWEPRRILLGLAFGQQGVWMEGSARAYCSFSF